MLRAIIRRRYKDQHNGLETDELETVDFHSEVLEEALGSGGYSESGYEYRGLAGIEILGGRDSTSFESHHQGICKCPTCTFEGGADGRLKGTED